MALLEFSLKTNHGKLFFDIIGRCCRSGREYTLRIAYINHGINQNGAYLVFDLPLFIHAKISSQTRWQHFTSISYLQISFSSLQTTTSTTAPTKSTTPARCWNTLYLWRFIKRKIVNQFKICIVYQFTRNVRQCCVLYVRLKIEGCW